MKESIHAVNAATHFSETRYILSQTWVLDFLINNCERFEPIEDAFARSVGDGDHNILLYMQGMAVFAGEEEYMFAVDEPGTVEAVKSVVG